MRLTNTITLRAHNKDKQQHEVVKLRIKEHYGKRVTFTEKTYRQDGFDDIHVLVAKLYHQPPQKSFIHDLKLFLDNPKELLAEAEQHLDEHNTLFFRIDQESFFTENWKFVLRGEVIQVRMNLCAHPKTRENAMKIITDLLA